jgi:hypothetical protein
MKPLSLAFSAQFLILIDKDILIDREYHGFVFCIKTNTIITTLIIRMFFLPYIGNYNPQLYKY